MKLLMLKLCALFVFVDGVLMTLWLLKVSPFMDYLNRYSAYLPGGELGTPTEPWLYLGGSILTALIGLYALMPKGSKAKRRPREIRFEGDHGEVVIQLDSVQRALTNVIMRMPEVKRVLVKVDAEDDGKRALITADAVIYSQPEVRARQTANNVAEYIAQSAIQVLGLEDLATIKLNVVGIEVNPKQASKHIRSEYQQRVEALKRPQLEYQSTASTTKEPQTAIRSSAAAVAPAPAPEPVPLHHDDFLETPVADTPAPAMAPPTDYNADAKTAGYTWEESREADGDLVIEADKEALVATAETEGVYNDGGFASTEKDETYLGPETDLPVAEESVVAEETEEKKRSWF